MAKKVRYRVKAPCFVNDTYWDPAGRKDLVIEAPEGLAGKALEPVEEAPAKAKDQGKAKE